MAQLLEHGRIPGNIKETRQEMQHHLVTYCCNGILKYFEIDCEPRHLMNRVSEVLPFHDRGACKIVSMYEGVIRGILCRHEESDGRVEWHWFGCTDIGLHEFMRTYINR